MNFKKENIITEQKDLLTRDIVDRFDRYNEKRQKQLQSIKEVKDEIYFNQNPLFGNWKNSVMLPDLYELAQTLKAHLIENLYSNPESMFDVVGITPEAQNVANNHKAMLVSTFERMNFKDQMEKLVDSIVETGEATLFVGWDRKFKQKRRPKTLEEKFLEPEDRSDFIVEAVMDYDGPIVKCINSCDFVFDAENLNNFDNADKIYRTYLDADTIVSDKNNNLIDDQMKEEILILSKAKNSKDFALYSNVCASSKAGFAFGDFKARSAYENEHFCKAKKNELLEVLEFYGNIKLKDGTILKNYLVTVVGRSKIVRLEPNPYIINPFVFASVIEDPITKRGISPLKVAVILSSISSGILNKQLDALSLIINPPYLAPKGCFKGEQLVKPGKIIEYDAALMPQTPQPLDFSQAVRGWDFIKFFKTQIESATGIFRNMSGELRENSAKTATEFSYSVSSQAVRLNMLIDAISRKLIIPMVQKVAEITSNFKFGNETLPFCEKGHVRFIEINDNSRCACDFMYRYGDRKAILDRKSRFTQLFNLIGTFAKMPNFANQIDWVKCFKFTLEQFGVENPDSFLVSQENVAGNAFANVQNANFNKTINN